MYDYDQKNKKITYMFFQRIMCTRSCYNLARNKKILYLFISYIVAQKVTNVSILWRVTLFGKYSITDLALE